MLEKDKATKKSLLARVEQLKKIQEESLEEQIMKMKLENIENERLNDVFHKLCSFKQEGREGKQQPKDKKNRKDKKEKKEKKQQHFGFQELTGVLTRLNYKWSKMEVQKMIWEVDENLDRMVDREEFELMYKRCVFDKTGLQPRSLFNLVQFLMYDKTNRGTITVEDTLELIYVREGDKLNETIRHIFGDKEITDDGQERQISFEEYLKQIRKRDLMIRKELEKERKKVSQPQKKQD